MNNEVLVSNYIFKCIVVARFPDAFRAVYDVLNDYGVVASQDYYNREIKGKWNPIVKGVNGANINIWTGHFNFWEEGKTTVIRVILTGGNDSLSAKIMTNYLFRKLKRYVNVIGYKQINTKPVEKEKSKTEQTSDNRNFFEQLNNTLDFFDAIIPEKKKKPKMKYKDPWDNYDDVSLYPDEDHESHDHEADGYCIESDEYIQDMM